MGILLRVSLVVLVFVVAFFPIAMSVRRRDRKRRAIERRYRDKIQSRDRISFQDFAHTYFPSRNPRIVCAILESIKGWLRVPTGRLHPDDRIYEDLALGVWDCLEPFHLVADIEDRLHGEIGLSDDDDVQTLGQFVELCCTRLEESSQRTQGQP